MNIELHLPDLTNTKKIRRTYNPTLDDIRSILMDVCQSVERRGKFQISGFGQDVWPVNIGTDLAIFMEQLPIVIRSIASNLPAEIDLYEQGVERTISFSPTANNTYLASCTSHTNWQPNPEIEQVDRDSLQQMLLTVRNEFMRLIREIAPGLDQHPWVKSWHEGRNM
jgi:hypothetical protein